ncbi:[SSU ribosomal protein S18P]-alanine acetyltransferase [Malonomonas rubra DSM 5091]|uniref:[Ribosomal protein bS18]-alanine N-acetyltransferase n=1 Tax=Malonomonas rubra DSM 5091 TaxID=1122189 RepID=A0A1M6DN44_MALRU|nr:ribosomal protein S18-alanine N-acetyltransferase [Malonomonas rubra]SHI74378.1 [SSU ribosomal protein S18P]-alanine acetyltransferase [Malonomonas rubra DSM 5091]
MSNDYFHIKPLEEKDLPAVLQVEQQSYPHPWSSGQFRQELNNAVSSVELLWHDEQLAGYICYWLIAGEMQILNVATAPEFRRQGVGSRLLQHAFDRCASRGLERAWLEVRTGNAAAIALYRKHGFVADVVRSGYYRDGEDALLMVKDFPPAGQSE